MDRLPSDVVAFVNANLRSLDHLQVLISCIDGRDRWWDAPAMAREAGITESVARQTLDHLARRNLLDIRVTADVRYTFSPGSDGLREATLAFATAYRSRPVKVVQLWLRDYATFARLRPSCFAV